MATKIALRHNKVHPGSRHTTCGLEVCSSSVKMERAPEFPTDCPHCLAGTLNPRSLLARIGQTEPPR